LFGFLASEHKAGIRCTRDAGCCLRPEFLAADGSLTDVYFMWRPPDVVMEEHAAEVDLWNALIVTCEMAGPDAVEMGGLLATATRHYTGKTRLSRDVLNLIEGASQGFVNGDPTRLRALLEIALQL
jgi:hypothetical protein